MRNLFHYYIVLKANYKLNNNFSSAFVPKHKVNNKTERKIISFLVIHAAYNLIAI